MSEIDQETSSIDYRELGRNSRVNDLSYISVEGLSVPTDLARKALDDLYTGYLLSINGLKVNPMRGLHDQRDEGMVLNARVSGMEMILGDFGMREQVRAVYLKALEDSLKMGLK